MMLATLLTVLPLMGTALAHLQMKSPLPIDSPLGAGQPKNVDSYSYTAPLKLDGSQWPCHGSAYLSDPSLLSTQATWPAGSDQSFTIAPPGAEHGGGSCQLSLSYDNGKTWNVIWSWIGGCMADTSQFTQTFNLPSEAPSGKALFAWGWFNQLGNREMYHNCAVVEITNGGSGLDSNDYPAPFVANAGVNQCSTLENVDPVFLNPGKNVKYGGAYTGTVPEAGKGITGTNCDAPGGAGSGSGNGGGGGGGAASSSAPASTAAPSSTKTGKLSVTASIGHVLGAVSGDSQPTTYPTASSASAPSSEVASTPATSTASASSPASSSANGRQRVCKRRRSMDGNRNRVKRAPSPVPAPAPPSGKREVERPVTRSRHFAKAAGHAARRYSPHGRF